MNDAERDRLIAWIRSLPTAATVRYYEEGAWISPDGRDPDPPPDPTPVPEPVPSPPVPPDPPTPATG